MASKLKAKHYEFGELDSEDEIIEAVERIENRLANEVNALSEEIERLNDKVFKKSKGKKGFVMKNVLMSIAVIGVVLGLGAIVFAQGYVQSDINYDIASNPESLAQYLEDTIGTVEVFRLTPTTTPTTQILEGQIYYDDASNAIFVSTDGSTFTELASAAGQSLDGVYNAGSKVTVDTGVIEFEAANSLGVAALLVDYDDDTTNAMDAMQITNAGDDGAAVSLQIDSTAGFDIQGTGDTWNVTLAGVANLVGLVTTTGDVTFTGANYNIVHDADADQLEFKDSAQLSFGTGEDVEISFDETDLVFAFDDLDINFGSDGAGGDIYIYSEAASSLVTFTEDTDDVLFVAYDIDLDDNSNLVVGSDDEWNIDNATETLRFIPSDTDDDFDFHIGSVANTTDIAIFGKNASTIVFDSSNDHVIFTDYDLTMADGEEIRFGTGASAGAGDMLIQGTSGAVLLIDDVVAGTGTIEIGDDADDIPLTWWGETTGANFILTGDTVLLDGMDMTFEDGDFLIFGDGSDFTIDSSTAKQLDIAPAGADELYSVHIGIASSGVDLSLHGTDAGDLLLWDASDDYLHMIGDKVLFTLAEASAANVFKVDATGASGDTDVIVLETTDGGIMLLADGDTEGDITLDAEDDITITAAGDLVYAVTGTFNVAGSILTNTGVVTEVVTGTTDTLTAAQSGSMIVYTMTGGACTVTLPAAAAGLWFILIDGDPAAGEDLTIDPTGDDFINGDAAGEYIKCENDRDGEGVVIFATSATAWYTMACGSSTVWTEE